MARQLLLMLRKEVSGKITFFGRKNSLPLMLKRTGATAGTHADLSALDVDKNVQVSPFWKMPTNLSPPLLGGWKKSVPHFQL
jgi:hypothetical protein